MTGDELAEKIGDILLKILFTVVCGWTAFVVTLHYLID